MPRGNILRSQARQMVHDVLTFMRNEAQEGLQFDLKAVQKRTAAATGVSERTVRRIAAVANIPGASMQELLRTPGRTRKGRKKVTAISSIDRGAIKRFIHNYHLTEKELPTVKQLLKRLKELGLYKGQSSSMRRVLTDMGFQWKKTEDRKKVLIEHASIRQKRIEYLQAMTKYRAEGRPVVFADISHVNTASVRETSSKIPKKCERVNIALAVSDNGLLQDTLLTFKSISKNEDNKQYDKWLRTQLMANLPIDSVVVVGAAPFLNKSEDAGPTSTSNRTTMESWLIEKGIPFTSTMLKPQLYKLVCTYKSGYRQYKIDGVLNENDHPVLRVPPCHQDLNPLEVVWTAVKSYVESKADRKVDPTRLNIHEKVLEINSEMADLCKKVETIEEEYNKSDCVIDALTDEVTMRVSDNDSDSETDEDSGSEQDEDDESSSDDEASGDVEVMEVYVSPKAFE